MNSDMTVETEVTLAQIGFVSEVGPKSALKKKLRFFYFYNVKNRSMSQKK